MILSGVEDAKRVLTDDEAVLYGIFGMIGHSGYFPTRELLNEFLMAGNDPCDQDGRMDSWLPFALQPDAYEEVKEWWIANHPGTVVSDLGQMSWDEWIEVILNPEDFGFPGGLPHPSKATRS